MTKFNAEVTALGMFYGLAAAPRSLTTGNWTVRELNSFTCIELRALNHESHSELCQAKGKRRGFLKATISRIANVMHKRAERRVVWNAGDHRLIILEEKK